MELGVLSSLSPPIVVVPSQRIKAWLQRQFADAMGIAMGMRFMGLMPAIDHVYQACFEASCKQPLFVSKSLLALDIEEALDKILTSDELKQQYSSLIRYVKPDKLISKQIQSLSHQLATNFLQYARFGGEFLKAWRKKEGWQQFLWKETLEKRGVLSDLLSEKKVLKKHHGTQLHLFALPFIPELFMNFLDRHSKRIKISHYVLSPCQVFYGDILSDRQKIALKEHAADSDFGIDNALLANWGYSGKLYQNQLETFNYETVEDYQPLEDKNHLSKLQNAILLSNRSDKTKQKNDLSMQVHAASSKLREVEILKETLIHLIVTSKNTIDPRNILVMAPDISDYVPFIEKVFGEQGCPFNYAVDDVPADRSSAFLKGLSQLIELFKGRFSLSEILDFVSNPCFLKRWKFTFDDVNQLEKWAKKGSLKWGLSKKQRDESLSLPEHRVEMLEASNIGTWEFVFDGILSGLGVIQDESMPQELYPLDYVENSLAELLGEWIHFFRSLKKGLDIKLHKTIMQWKAFLLNMVDDYLDVSVDEAGYGHFLNTLDTFDSSSTHLFSFESFWRCYLAEINSKTTPFHAQDLNAIQFCSMRTGRVCPSSIIWCMGMQDGAFPRSEGANPFNQMESDGDAFPTHLDEDRYLFLQIVISAQKFLHMSYIARSESDGGAQNPSLLIQELFQHLDLSIYYHPAQPFDQTYFSKTTAYPSYSQLQYDIAKDVYENKLTKRHVLFPQFFHADEQKSVKINTSEVDVNDLFRFAKNPIAFFLKNILNVYLNYDDQEEAKEFHLSSLDKHLFRKDMSKDRKALSRLCKAGRLPLGPFGELALRSSEKTIHLSQKKLQKMGVNEFKSIHIQLDKCNVKPLYIAENHWVLPAPQMLLSGKNPITLTGSFDGLISSGLLIPSKSQLSDLIVNWPFILVMQLLAHREKLWEPKAFFIEDGKSVHSEDPDKGLKAYLEYYLSDQPSILMPAWANSLLCGEAIDLKKAIKATLNQQKDPYLQWAFSFEDHFDAYLLHQQYARHYRQIFQECIGLHATV